MKLYNKLHMLLSVAIAVHNEEKNILRCLQLVYDWVDEIIIVDGASTDQTTQIISNFDTDHKITLYTDINPPMFHINKQKAIDHCSGDWILQLDADEQVSKSLKTEILLTLKNPTLPTATHSQTVAFWLPRLNFFMGKPLRKGGQYPDYTVRLYRKGVARFPGKSVHEQVEISQSQLKSDIGYLKSDLLHFPYPTFADYIKKWRHYCQLEAQTSNAKINPLNPLNTIKYVILYPIHWFFKTYFRHLGFIDGFAGFIFSFFSSIRFWGIYYYIIVYRGKAEDIRSLSGRSPV